MTELNLEFEGYRVNYYEWGNKGKPTIVCLHGLANSAATFSELAKYLLVNYNVLSFDNPGHGKTSSFENEEDYLFSKLAKWYDKIFHQVLKEPFYILGHSWGADIALHYAKWYPNNIKGIILLDGGFTFPDNQEDMTFPKVYYGWNDYMDNSSVYNTWSDVLREYKQYTKCWNNNLEQIVSTLFKKDEIYELIVSKFTVLSIIKAFFKESFTTTYSHLTSPLLLVHATLPEDLRISREKGIKQLKQHVQDVKIVSMNETNHMVHWDNPEMVSDKIHKWINEFLKI